MPESVGTISPVGILPGIAGTLLIQGSTVHSDPSIRDCLVVVWVTWLKGTNSFPKERATAARAKAAGIA